MYISEEAFVCRMSTFIHSSFMKMPHSLFYPPARWTLSALSRGLQVNSALAIQETPVTTNGQKNSFLSVESTLESPQFKMYNSEQRKNLTVLQNERVRYNSDDTILNVAVMWDVDNIPARVMDGIMMDLANKNMYSSVRYAFGNCDLMANKKKGGENIVRDVVLRHGFRPRPTITHVAGKNTTDIEMVVSSLQLAYTEPNIHGFVLVSSDSDFTPLAIALREMGKLVMGYGQEQTVASFAAVCTDFTRVKIEKLEE